MSDSELRRLFANNLRHYLNLHGYSQADMARYMKVSTATTAKWCTGVTMPRVDKIQSLCNWFGIEKSDLLDERKSEKQDTNDDTLWYTDPATKEIAQKIHEDPQLRTLFDAAKDASPEDLETIQTMMEALLRKERHED